MIDQKQYTTVANERPPMQPSITLPASVKEIKASIESIDKLMNTIINLILHDDSFQALESIWLGVHQLIQIQSNNQSIQLSLLNLTKSALINQAEEFSSIESTPLYDLIYNQEFNMPGGIPYDCIIGDYHFSHEPQDVRALTFLGEIAERSFCPFIMGANAKLLYQNDWGESQQKNHIDSILSDNNHIAWHQLRQNSCSKFISLIAPDFLGRYKYQSSDKSFNFNFKEICTKDADYCWINGAFAQAQCLMNAFNTTGWCTAIRGFESGGKLSNLPLTHNLKGIKCQFSDLEEKQLSTAGITTICQYKRSNYAVIFSSETLHEAPQYEDSGATYNAKISARLPYVMAVSRFTHYIKIIARDKIGAFLNQDDIQHWLNQWLLQYVNANAASSHILKAKFPLAEAKVEVEKRDNMPGGYHAVIHLKPWLQLEELSVSVRLVTNLPGK